MTRCTVISMSLGASKRGCSAGIDNGEQMFLVFNQRMLITVLNSARVFDPGGKDKMKKVNREHPCPTIALKFIQRKSQLVKVLYLEKYSSDNYNCCWYQAFHFIPRHNKTVLNVRNGKEVGEIIFGSY